MTSYQSYIVCTSPRSGSTLLCKLLAQTNKAGKPDSHFHSPSVTDWMGYYNIEPDGFASERDLLAAIVQAARERGTGNTGMFGLRMQGGSFDFFMQKLQVLCPSCTSDSERIEGVFGPTFFVYLTRQNKLDQAISLVKAKQTGLWHKAPDGTELERLSAPREPVYDADAIALHFAELTTLDECWSSWFAKEKLEPLRIHYDDLAADPLEVVGGLLEQLGLQQEITRSVILPVAKLADKTSRRWAERYLAENRG